MSTLYKWRVKCDTDNTFEYIWDEDKPTTCPINNGHTIDNTKTTIVDQNVPNVLKIQEEDVPTGGNYRCTTVPINASAGVDVVTTVNHSWKIPVSIFSISFVTKDEHEGDKFDIVVAPETIVGLLTDNIAIGVDVIPVDATVMANVCVGYTLIIDNTINVDNLGEIIEIDTVNNTVTTENTTSFAFLTGSVIKTHTRIVKDYTIGPSWEYIIGESKIGGSYISSNRVIQLNYTNKTNVAKNLYIQIEYTY